jgi:uncharacterized SAM-binding protein YcdF (DUF218 family)
MTNRIITDISDYIFVSDEPQKVDAIFLPGGSHPEQPEYAAELYLKGMAEWLVTSGGVSVKADKWHGVRSKADIYDGDYHSDCEFFTDVLVKNGVPITAIIVCKAFHARRCLMLYQMAFPNVDIKVCPVHCYNITKENWYKTEKGTDRVLGELARCGNQFVGDIKHYLEIM